MKAAMSKLAGQTVDGKAVNELVRVNSALDGGASEIHFFVPHQVLILTGPRTVAVATSTDAFSWLCTRFA